MAAHNTVKTHRKTLERTEYMDNKKNYTKDELDAFRKVCELNNIKLSKAKRDDNSPIRVVAEDGKEYLVYSDLSYKPAKYTYTATANKVPRVARPNDVISQRRNRSQYRPSKTFVEGSDDPIRRKLRKEVIKEER